MQIQHILVVVDPHGDNAILLERAALLASRFKAKVELFLADYRGALQSSYPFAQSEFDEVVAAYLRNKGLWLKSLAQDLIHQGIAVTTLARWEIPLHDAVLNRAKELGADMILKATHHHSLVQRALFTNTDWHLIRNSEVPIWFVKNQIWGNHVRLMAAVDPMHSGDKPADLDNRILEATNQLADKLPGEIHVVHVYEVMATGIVAEFDEMLADSRLFRDEVQRRHRLALNELAAQAVRPGSHIVLEEGLAEQVLTRYAVDHAIDLTIMGAVSRSALGRLFIGNTAERVLDELDSDVLVLR